MSHQAGCAHHKLIEDRCKYCRAILKKKTIKQKRK